MKKQASAERTIASASESVTKGSIWLRPAVTEPKARESAAAKPQAKKKS